MQHKLRFSLRPLRPLRYKLCRAKDAKNAKVKTSPMSHPHHADSLERIQSALEAARQVFTRFTAGAIEAEYKAGHDPVTEADKAVDAVLQKELLRAGEGWLS